MTYLGFYLLTLLDKIVTLSAVLFLISSIAIGLLLLSWAFSVDDYSQLKHNTTGSILKKAKYVLIISGLLSIFIPSSKEFAFIYIAPQVIENGAVKETVKNIPELTQLATEYLKELLKEKTKKLGE